MALMGAAMDEYEKKQADNPGPFHIVNALTNKHMGPFTTETDALLARMMASMGSGWKDGKILNRVDFDAHLWKYRNG